MGNVMTKENLKRLIIDKLQGTYSLTPDEAPDHIYYQALCSVVKDILGIRRRNFSTNNYSQGSKKVYYLCIEFLLGRSLKNNLYNLGIESVAREVLDEFDVRLDNLFELEPDAGLGNGGLGRLAACYMDGLATCEYPATGYSICYEFGIFKQKIVDGWQTELPDHWLPGGDIWLTPRYDHTVDVNFGGEVHETWTPDYHDVSLIGCTTIKAVPYDMFISGYNSSGVSRLRLWKASNPSIDMDLFNSGDYIKALSQTSLSEVLSKILYPNDNHLEGKKLRLRQQYFLCAASIADIVRTHLQVYQTLDNFSQKVAIHINDTHPALAIAELMKVLLDDCGYEWERAWRIVCETFAYTNHTVMPEALETWNEELFKRALPRIYRIIKEINERYCQDLFAKTNGDLVKISRMAIVANNSIRMANLCCAVCHSINGVSKIHSEIIKETVFGDFYSVSPEKFKNVTNGIATRRWLLQSNEGLTSLITELLGSDAYIKDMGRLEELRKFDKDKSVLQKLEKIKTENKIRLAKYILDTTGVKVNTASIFDVQVKRLHEYKRQHLNALHILTQYRALLRNPDMEFTPKTYIFGAKAAPGYYLAKQIIRFICALRDDIEKHPKIAKKLRIVYLEDYKVTLSELLMPASEISEQISLAGTEASGTGNMKFMLNGAITLGTLDGANIEIRDMCGSDNIFIFGMNTEEVRSLERRGYSPEQIYNNNHIIKDAVDLLYAGIGDCNFTDIAENFRRQDRYMALADFESYRKTQEEASRIYADTMKWQKMSLHNIAGSGFFSADRSIRDYARDIWDLDAK